MRAGESRRLLLRRCWRWSRRSWHGRSCWPWRSRGCRRWLFRSLGLCRLLRRGSVDALDQFVRNVVFLIEPEEVVIGTRSVDNYRVTLLVCHRVQNSRGSFRDRAKQLVTERLQLFLSILVDALQFRRATIDIPLQIGLHRIAQCSCSVLKLFLLVLQFLLLLFDVTLSRLERAVEFLRGLFALRRFHNCTFEIHHGDF